MVGAGKCDVYNEREEKWDWQRSDGGSSNSKTRVKANGKGFIFCEIMLIQTIQPVFYCDAFLNIKILTFFDR